MLTEPMIFWLFALSGFTLHLSLRWSPLPLGMNVNVGHAVALQAQLDRGPSTYGLTGPHISPAYAGTHQL